MIWRFASAYPGRIAIAALALLVAAGATSGVPWAFKLIIDKLLTVIIIWFGMLIER